MMVREETRFITSDQYVDQMQFEMKEFTDSFNFMVGSSDRDVDLLNNKYINLKLYGLNQTYKPFPLEGLSLTRCKVSNILQFMSEESIKYYPNSVCIDDYSKFNLDGNWNLNSYHNIIISAEYCVNSTENSNFCAP